MNGEKGRDARIPPEEALQEIQSAYFKAFEKQDFDLAFSGILSTIRPQLDKNLSNNFGIRLKFIHDAELGELNEDVSYDHAYNLKKKTDGPEVSVVGVELRPGAVAINELVQALDEFGTDDIRGIHHTLSHQMYSSGLITKAYLEAAISEIKDGVDPLLRTSAENVINYLTGVTQLKRQIEDSDLENQHQLSDLLDYLEPKNSLDINRHRFAASLFLKLHPEHNAIPVIMQRYLDSQLTKIAEEETTERAINREIYDIEHEDTDLAVWVGEDSETIYRIIDANKAKAALIRQHIVGWAFPMDVDERKCFYGIINEFSDD